MVNKIIILIVCKYLYLPKIKGMKYIFLILFLPLSIFSQNEKIHIYFNKSVDNEASNLVDAMQVVNIDDTIISYIDKAIESIDFCIYNSTNTQIVSAVNNAYSRGVAIRYIMDSGTSNSALYGMNSNINTIENNSTGIMHNKFVIIDYGIPENTVLITGSTNFTSQSIDDDYNNIIIFEDNAIAQPYLTEFEEMWGSSTLTPNSSNAKFGTAKFDNTVHTVNVNGTDVEVYFSPSDNTTSKLVNTINSANDGFYFAQFYLTENSLGTAVRSIYNSGVEVKGCIEMAATLGSEYQSFIDLQMEVYSYEDVPAILHHKYCIVDPFNQNSDPIAVTGSHNWSSSAETKNDENTVIVHDLYVAQTFYEEFNARIRQANYIAEVSNEVDCKVVISNNEIIIESFDYSTKSVLLYTIDGKQVFNSKLSNSIRINTYSFNKGIYLLKIFDNKTSNAIKVIL